MTELETLRQRRELVVLAAELQRANIVRRLERLQENPARRILGFAAGVIRRPAMISIGTAAVRMAYRFIQRKRARRTSH